MRLLHWSLIAERGTKVWAPRTVKKHRKGVNLAIKPNRIMGSWTAIRDLPLDVDELARSNHRLSTSLIWSEIQFVVPCIQAEGVLAAEGVRPKAYGARARNKTRHQQNQRLVNAP